MIKEVDAFGYKVNLDITRSDMVFTMDEVVSNLLPSFGCTR